MTLEWLTSWWNLVFIVPFGLALLYLGFYAFTGLTFGDAEADADFDTDADVSPDVGADADVGADVDADAGVHADVDTDADAGAHLGGDADTDADTDAGTDADAHGDAGAHSGSAMFEVLSWVGVGRAPLSLLLMVLLLTWGAIGFAINSAVRPAAADGWRVALVSLPVAALGSLLATRLLAGLVGRVLPMNQTTARRRHELLGCVGQALFPINERFGLVCVRDERGELYQVPCRVDGAGQTVPKGCRVRLVGYSAKDKSFFVTPLEPDDAAAPGAAPRP